MSGSRENRSKPKKDMARVLPCMNAVTHSTHGKAKQSRRTASVTRIYIKTHTMFSMYIGSVLIIMAETDVVEMYHLLTRIRDCCSVGSCNKLFFGTIARTNKQSNAETSISRISSLLTMGSFSFCTTVRQSVIHRRLVYPFFSPQHLTGNNSEAAAAWRRRRRRLSAAGCEELITSLNTTSVLTFPLTLNK